MGTPSIVEQRIVRWTSFAAVALYAVTWPLWFPGFSDGDFPIVPLLSLLVGWPVWIDTLLSLLLIASWLGLFFRSGQREAPALKATVIVVGLFLVLLNQHRLQPWHYQFLIIASLTFGQRSAANLGLLRVLVISIYAYSALSKFDFEFVHTVGQQFLGELLGVLRVEPSGGLWYLVWLIPSCELLLALLLCFRRTRPVGGILACLQHLTLLFVLGPWGLDHSWGVLLWNVYSAGLVWLLFVRPESAMDRNLEIAAEEQTPRQNLRVEQRLMQPASWLLAVVVLMPLGERLGFWDHWPSWSLYAPHSSRVEAYVARTVVDRLPTPLSNLIMDAEEDQLWVRVPLGDWSLQSLGAPIYPQGRFQAGVVRHLAESLDSEFEIRATLLGPAGRVDGKRETRQREGSRDIQKFQKAFWFNTEPRLKLQQGQKP
jgi:hypothetical protein